MIYVMTGSSPPGPGTTAACRGGRPGGRSRARAARRPPPSPTSPASLYQAPPRSYAERAYNITRWTDLPSGGHFAAMEEPDLFVDDVRAWAAGLDS